MSDQWSNSSQAGDHISYRNHWGKPQHLNSWFYFAAMLDYQRDIPNVVRISSNKRVLSRLLRTFPQTVSGFQGFFSILWLLFCRYRHMKHFVCYPKFTVPMANRWVSPVVVIPILDHCAVPEKHDWSQNRYFFHMYGGIIWR